MSPTPSRSRRTAPKTTACPRNIGAVWRVIRKSRELPEAYRLVRGGGGEEGEVGGDGDAVHIVGVPRERARGDALRQRPDAHGLVLRTGDDCPAVRRNRDAHHPILMAREGLAGGAA